MSSKNDPSDEEFVRAESIRLNIDGLRDQVCAWLRANGIDPGRIPIDSTLTRSGDQLTFDVYARGADGKLIFSRSGKNELERASETRTITVEPPPAVVAWPGLRTVMPGHPG